MKPDTAFTFTPGQYVTIGAEGIERPYSIVSAPFEPLVELFIERVPPEHGGALTPILHRLRPGDAVSMRPRPKGRFTRRVEVSHHVMVATVTGIAPYVSMIRQFLHDRAADPTAAKPQRFYVMQGASYQDELVYDRELRATSDQYPELIQYVGTVSRPLDARNDGWKGPTGRVNAIVDERLSNWAPPKDDTVIYLCGNPGMIADVKGRLTPQGWAVAEEQYWRP